MVGSFSITSYISYHHRLHVFSIELRVERRLSLRLLAYREELDVVRVEERPRGDCGEDEEGESAAKHLEAEEHRLGEERDGKGDDLA